MAIAAVTRKTNRAFRDQGVDYVAFDLTIEAEDDSGNRANLSTSILLTKADAKNQVVLDNSTADAVVSILAGVSPAVTVVANDVVVA